MNFVEASKAVKEGKKISRESWNGKDMFVCYIPYYVPTSNFKSYTEVSNSIVYEDNLIHYNPCVVIKNNIGSVSTWVPSVNDCLAEDWFVVE